MSVEDKVVIITRATGTLGQVVVRKFAQQGARLALFGRSIEHLEELASGLGLPEESHLLHAADFSDPRAAQTATEAVIQKFGRAEIILHLVGGFTGGKSVIDVAADDMLNMIRQHVWTTFHLAQSFTPHLTANGWGRIVVVSSPLALDPPGNNAPYAVGKAGQEMLMLSLAQELAGTGVTANVILVRSIGARSDSDGRSASRTTPEEIVATITYLCSDEAGMVNGARIPVYGRP